MKTNLCVWGWVGSAVVGGALAQAPLEIGNDHFRYRVSPAGLNVSFVDRATGKDYLRPGESRCAWVVRGGRETPVSAVVRSDDRLRLQFGDTGVEAVVKVEVRPACVGWEVESVVGDEVEALCFLNVPLTLQGRPEEAFGACAFSLNLQTRVDQLPALQTELRASARKKFGMVGAKVALVGMPMSGVLGALKEVLQDAKELPLCKVAGPWAGEIPFNHGSYLFNFGALTETNVQEWVEMVRSLGLTQIDHHGGGAGFFRFGDFALHSGKWPQGWETYRRMVARLHDAGIGSIFHTYAFFIDKQAKYVTPVPDRRLDAFRTFTLARPVSADADVIEVNESTAGMSTVTGFFEHNSVLLHLGDELVTFGGVSQESPWRFTGVGRGALGTRAAAHAAGAQARHLKECFGLLVPDPESSLFEEIAANHAEVVNQADFDGIYLDAIDGSSILRGPDECWYWADKFVVEIQKRLRKPVGMEMSAMWHHFWQYRTRWQAWDYPQRGHRRFVDLHAEAVHGGLLLPLHLGWWNFQSFDPPQVEPTYPDVIEHLGARLVGWDAGISLTGAVDRNRLREVPLFRRAVDTLRQCEELRQAGGFSAAAKARLRDPQAQFELAADAQGGLGFREVQAEAHTVELAASASRLWSITNRFGDQPLRLRVEALMAVGSVEGEGTRREVGPTRADEAAWVRGTAKGVALGVEIESAEQGGPGLVLSATNMSQVPRNAAWARLQRRHQPPLNLKGREALGFWVEGDGQGALLAIRLESPRHLAFGAVADRYLPIDFTGRRFCTLVETESSRWSDYAWEDGKALYNVYRETIHFDAVDAVTVALQNLPAGQPVRCRVGPIQALPLVRATAKQPRLTVGGVTMRLPVELASGGWVECLKPGEGVLYGPKGEVLTQFAVAGVWPQLRAGVNAVEFDCESEAGPAPRVRVTLFAAGDRVQ